MLLWLHNTWAKFEAWVDSVAPGVKVKTLAALGLVGNTAFMLKDFIGGLPPNVIFSAESLVAINLTLYVLTYWLRNIGDRVEARDA